MMTVKVAALGSSYPITESREKGRVSWDQTWSHARKSSGGAEHARKGSEQDIGKQPTKEVCRPPYEKRNLERFLARVPQCPKQKELVLVINVNQRVPTSP